MKKHWYFYSCYGCKCCGKVTLARKERQYTIKPKNKHNRYGIFYGICPSCSEDLSPVEIREMGG